MNRMQSRIQRLEHKCGLSGPKPPNIFITCFREGPVIGFRCGSMDIMRLKDETDDALQDRAIETARAGINSRIPLAFLEIRGPEQIEMI